MEKYEIIAKLVFSLQNEIVPSLDTWESLKKTEKNKYIRDVKKVLKMNVEKPEYLEPETFKFFILKLIQLMNNA